MTISFQKKEEYFTFHDPTQNGKLIDRKTEIRFDPLTGETSRIIFDPGSSFTPTDYTALAEATKGEKCPFCPENVSTFTPTFPDHLIKGGRFVSGEAVAFPNLFPYSKHNAVVRMCDQHYVKLQEFSVEMIANSFITTQAYLEKVVHSDQKTAYASINWNYLPPSGGSILHPHIHVLASEFPTNYQAKTNEKARAFYNEHKENYFLTLKEKEYELQERWIKTEGMVDWMHAFAPKSHCDFIGIFQETPSLSQLNEEKWKDFAEGIISFFHYFQQIGLASFNLAVFIPLQETPNSWVHVRLIPRLTIGALGTSDMNVFNYLHSEPLSLKVPEQVAKEAAACF